MQKKIIILFVALSFVMASSAQETLAKQQTLEQAKQAIDDVVKELEQRPSKRELLISIPTESELTDIRVSDDKPPIEHDVVALRKRMLNYFSKSSFNQTYDNSSSDLIINNLHNSSILKQVQKGSLSDKEYLPQVELRTIYYSDGSMQTRSELIVGGRLKNLYNTKPIDSIVVDINYVYPTYYQLITLSKDSTQQFTQGSYNAELISIGGKCVETIFSSELASDDIISPTVVGITQDEAKLSNKCSKITLLNSRSSTAQIHYVLSQMKDVQAKFNANEYATIEDYNIDMDSKDKVITKHSELRDSKIVFCFDEPIEGLKVYYPTALDTISQSFTLKNERIKSAKYAPKNLVRIDDRETRKYGFVDMEGNLVLPTEYGRIEYLGGKLFKEDRASSWGGMDTCYVLDLENKRLDKCDFVVGHLSVSDKEKEYIRVEKNVAQSQTYFSSEWLVGLINLNGDILVPIHYRGIPKVFYEDGFAIVSNKDGCGLYKFGEGEVLPAIYKNIDVAGSFLYTKKDSAISIGDIILTDVFDFNLKQINASDWNLLSNFGFDAIASNSLVRVRDKQTGRDFYMNTRGEMQIPPSNEYDYGNDFNYGLVVVRKDDKYGYMNTEGKIVIPIVYDYASDYTGRSMFVEKKGEFMIINAQRKILKKLNSDLVTFDRSAPGEPINTRYELKDGSVYGDDGNLIQESRNE